jgi:hypothetical protein
MTTNASLDTTTTKREPTFNGSTSLSHAGTSAAGNRVAVLCMMGRHTLNYAGMTVTYGGTAMTLRASYDASNDLSVAVWTLDLGLTLYGTRTVSVTGGTNSGSDAFFACGTFFSDGYESNQSATSGSITLTTANSLGAAMGCTISGGGGTLSETSGTRIYYYSYAAGYDVGCSYKIAVASTTVLSWTNGARTVGVAMKGYTPPGGGTPVATAPFFMI